VALDRSLTIQELLGNLAKHSLRLPKALTVKSGAGPGEQQFFCFTFSVTSESQTKVVTQWMTFGNTEFAESMVTLARDQAVVYELHSDLAALENAIGRGMAGDKLQRPTRKPLGGGSGEPRHRFSEDCDLKSAGRRPSRR
jgi:hypothetical protein